MAALEAALGSQDPETHLGSMFDTMFEGVQIIAPDWRYVYLNSAAAAHGRHAREDLIGRKMTEVYPGIDRTAMFRLLERCMTERVPQQMVNQFTYPDGRTAWFDLRMTPIPLGVLVLSVDLSVQQAAEEQSATQRREAREAEVRYQDLFNSVPVGLYRSAPDGTLLDANHAMAEMLGFPDQAALQGVNATALYQSLADRDRWRAAVEREAVVRDFEVQMRRRDGAVIWVRETAWTVHDANRRLLHYEGMVEDITQRKEAEEQLRESEAHYRSLFENMLNGFAYCRMVFDQGRPQDFVYLAVNGAFEILTGLKNVVGKKVSEVIPGIRESDPELFAIYGRVALTGVPERLEMYVAALKMWFAISVYSPRKDHFVAVFDVITERKHAEEGLRLFRALIDHANDAIEVIDPETGRFLDVNERACLDLGYRREQLLALSVPDLDSTVSPEVFAAVTTRLKESGSAVWEGIHRRKDGSTFPVEVNVNYVELDRDYIVTVVRDITQRKLAEADRVRLTAVVEQAVESVVITDTAGVILFVNPAFERTTGYSRLEVLGQSPRILKSGKQDAAFYRAMWDTLVAGKPWSGRFVNRKKDGTEYHVRQTVFPLRDAAGITGGYVGVGQDITTEVSLESQLRQAQKMESVGRLAGGVAHDFNNLLTVILGETELAIADLPDDHPARPGLGEVVKAAKRAEGLTRQLLAFSRQQVIEPTTFNLNDLVADVDKMLRRLIGEDVDLVSRTAPDLGAVRADRGQMEQVLLNLAVNARDAMPDGGELTIETANVTLDEEYARAHTYVKSGEYVLLAVSDSGVGMNEEVKAQIFEPFFTTKERGKGTGLGLATCYGIVKQAGGHITAYSEMGIGTTMKVYLPRLQEATDVPGGPPKAALLRGTETILLVEDEAGVRAVAARMLEAQGYRVLLAAHAGEALQLLEGRSDPVQLLLTDVVLPGTNGRVLAERAQLLRPGIKVLYASGYTDDVALRHQVVEQGASLVQKPFTAEVLGRKVREVLDAPRQGSK